MKVKLDFGAELDVLTQDELDRTLGKWAGLWAQRARGLEWFQHAAGSNDPGIGTGAYQTRPPASGYAWELTGLSVVVSAQQNVTVTWDVGGNLLVPGGSMPSASLATVPAGFGGAVSWGSKRVILKPGRSLYVQAAAGALIQQVYLTGVEVPAERLGLILA